MSASTRGLQRDVRLNSPPIPRLQPAEIGFWSTVLGWHITANERRLDPCNSAKMRPGPDVTERSEAERRKSRLGFEIGEVDWTLGQRSTTSEGASSAVGLGTVLAFHQRGRGSMDRKATAYHEAGHAVAAMESRVRLSSVSIIPDDESYGHCTYSIPWLERSPEIENVYKWRYRLENLAVVALSGVAAQELYLGGEPEHGFENDVDNALDYLNHLSGSDEELRAYFEWIRQRAMVLVSKPVNAAVIGGLAKALLEREELDQEVVRSIRADIITRMFPRRASTSLVS